MRLRQGPVFGAVPGAVGAVTAVLVLLVLAFLLAGAIVGALGAAGAIDTGAGEATASSRCVRWYPDFCVPAQGGDLDCDDLGRRSFTVRGADPFDFDEDLDGIGCEPQ